MTTSCGGLSTELRMRINSLMRRRKRLRTTARLSTLRGTTKANRECDMPLGRQATEKKVWDVRWPLCKTRPRSLPLPNLPSRCRCCPILKAWYPYPRPHVPASHFMSFFYDAETARRVRPFARRRASTARPVGLAMRLRKP